MIKLEVNDTYERTVGILRDEERILFKSLRKEEDLNGVEVDLPVEKE